MRSARTPVDGLLADVVIPVIRTSRTALAERAVEWLRQAGYATYEVTLTVPGALELIRELRRDAGILVGAGTVLTAAQAEACLAAGAQFVVSPVMAEELLPVCAEASVPALLTGLTPGEVYRAWSSGAAAVKVFPASSMGGPAHVRALKSVLPEVPLVPTGGVHLDNLAAYLAAGADGVGIGSDLISDARIERADAVEWIERASAYLEAVRRHRRDRVAGAA